MTTDAVDRAEKILRDECGSAVHRDFPLAPLTTFRIGGPAALFVEPNTMEDLRAVADTMREVGLATVVLGKGSNVLVSDSGFPGIVLRLGKGFRWVARAGDLLSAGGSMPLPTLSTVAWSHSLEGLEFGVGIPASFGGAVRMNAGSQGGSMGEIARTVEVFSLERCELSTISAAEAGFAYRGTAISGVVVAATVKLEPGQRAKIRERMDEVRQWRRATQPLGERSCGSVFKNPAGDHAARLIEAAGGRSMSVGGAAVSDKHANFIIASEGATAVEVVTLIQRVQEQVERMFGVRLGCEVHLIGDHGGVTL